MSRVLRAPVLAATSIVALAFALFACGHDQDESPSQADAGAARAGGPPTVTADGGPFVFTWISEDGGFETASQIEEIPEAKRALVRVQDPSRPPPPPGTVWIADLSEPQGGEGYPVRSMSRDEFLELGGRPRSPAPPEPQPDASPSEGADRPRAVMYMTSHCPVCHRARRWLAQNNVSFVERNIERDQGAAQELRQAAQRQGVSANGVPVFDIGGRLYPGFDQQVLSQALGL